MRRSKVLVLVVFLLVGFLSIGAAQKASAALVPADVVFIFDESGSMSNDQANVITNLGTFTTALTNAGIDAQYGLVGFGASSPNIHLVTDLTNAAGLSTALGTLVASGGTEPGFEATAFSLNNITWRGGSVKNLILITDEDSDDTEGGADGLLTQYNALWNGIVDINDTVGPAGDYWTLANNHGGTLFDIGAFRADPSGFITNFSQTKVREIITHGGVVPEPTSLSLLGLGLLGLLKRRKRNS